MNNKMFIKFISYLYIGGVLTSILLTHFVTTGIPITIARGFLLSTLLLAYIIIGYGLFDD